MPKVEVLFVGGNLVEYEVWPGYGSEAIPGVGIYDNGGVLVFRKVRNHLEGLYWAASEVKMVRSIHD